MPIPISYYLCFMKQQKHYVTVQSALDGVDKRCTYKQFNPILLWASRRPASATIAYYVRSQLYLYRPLNSECNEVWNDTNARSLVQPFFIYKIIITNNLRAQGSNRNNKSSFPLFDRPSSSFGSIVILLTGPTVAGLIPTRNQHIYTKS